MIGVIVAEEKEMIEVKNVMTNIKKIKIFENYFYEGIIDNKKIVLVKCNVGKVNSARICQMMIDSFNIELIINLGTAGSLDETLEIGDIVVADTILQYDFDVSAFGRKIGEIENIGEFISVDNNLLNLFDDKIKIGRIISGDRFIPNYEEKIKLKNTFNALCVEMEGASIAQVCYLDNIPFIIIRAISDKLDGSAKMEFEQFLSMSSKLAVNTLKSIIKKLT